MAPRVGWAWIPRLALAFGLQAVACPELLAADAALGCRAAIANTAERYVEEALGAREGCMTRILTGQTSPNADCIRGGGDPLLSNRLRRIRARVGRSFPNRCAGVSLATLGYPGPCQDTSGPPFDTRDVAACILSNTDAAIGDILTASYPDIDSIVFSGQVRCARGAGRKASRMAREICRTRIGCLLRQERGVLPASVACREDVPPYGPGTGYAYADESIAAAYTSVLSGVAVACGAIDVEALGYQADCPDPTGGGFELVDLKGCLFEATREGTAAFLAAAFPD